MFSDWLSNLVWLDGITFDTPLRQIGWTYVLIGLGIYKVITLIKKM